MNKIYHIASATLAMVLLLLTLGSCSKESQLAPETQPEAGAGQLTFKLNKDALRSVPAEAFEKAVDPASVWCVFLTSDPNTQTVKVAKPAIETPSGDYTIKADFEGAAQMFVIANVQDALKTKLEGLTTANTLADVQKLVVENALGDNTKAPDNFLMTSDLINVMLPTVGGAPYKVADVIKLKRLAARFDVISEVPGLTLTTISVANRVLSSTLLNVSQTGTNVAATTDYAVDGGKQLLHKIYSYQNTNKGGTTGATSFIIKGNYGSKAIKDIKVDLNNVADGQALDVQRNYCYRIIIKPAGNDDKPINPDPNDPTDPTAAWKVTIKVIDWNEAAADLANYSDDDLANLGDAPDPTINLNGKNLLNAVAEYNIDITGTKFATTHSNEAGNTGYFTWAEAKALQMPAGYHLPTRYEWTAILGSEWVSQIYVYFNQNEAKKDVSLMVQIPGQTGTEACLQDYKQVSAESATYMIRYKDNDTYRSAWRYSYEDSPIAGEGKILKIESVPVKAVLTIEQLNKDYFANPKVSKYVKTIYLPATGNGYKQNGSGSGIDRGFGGYYWSATESRSSDAYYVNINSKYARVDYRIDWTLRFAVRPFRGL
ncbi:hypothetical protein [Porphyromonas uenonis]|uniref:hypothetical protein n=1 Tax=Porphyromonas uenonis TaxID=281920 RepID=UPI00288B8796|nr:hypothetical protein [Porphyromonas uenonis]